MVSAELFQIAMGISGLFFVLLFADLIDTSRPDSVEAKILGALIFYTLEMFSILIPATTRQTYSIFGIYIPPLHVWWEALTLGFLAAAAWDIFTGPNEQ